LNHKETQAMKKYIILLGITILFGVSPSIFAQSFDPPIMPDSLYYSSNSSVRWFRNGTAFCYFNGANYAIVWRSEEHNLMYRWYPFVYTLQNNDLVPFETNNTNKLNFGYYDEDEYYYGTPYRKEVLIIGTSYAFSYYGYLWYSCVVQQPPHPFVFDPDVYYQLWARYDPTTNQWTTWVHKISPDPPENFNLGAYQVDSLLYMAYWDGSSESIRVARYNFDQETQDISYIDPVDIRLPAKKFGGMFAYKDKDGNTNMVYNTSTEGEGVWVTYDGPVIGHHDWALQGQNAGFSVMFQGSAQGMRPSESSWEGNRLNVFYLGANQQEDGSYPLYNWNWIIPKSGGPPYSYYNREVTLPSSHTARKIDGHWQLGWTYDMVPMDFSTQIDSADGLSKKLMVFYPDKDGRLLGAIFNSDNWRPVPNSIVTANDLANDSLYGPEIRKLWTLVGITDGAPPCSINWHVWDSTLNLNQHEPSATSFKFSTQTAQTSAVSSTYQDSYSLGGSINIGPQNILGMNMSFKYAQAFKSTVSSSHTVKSKITTNFSLNQESQQYGYYIWSIPQINRITYEVYPWFDNSSIAPIEATTQYRFITQGATIIQEKIPCNEFPFLIDDPNDPELYDFTENARQTMITSASTHSVSPLGGQGISWTSGNPGGFLDFQDIDKSVATLDTTTSYTWNESSAFGCPGIFKVSVNSTIAVSYSSRYSYQTELGNEVEISLLNLVKQSHGINFQNYSVNAYWFKPEKADWWYLDGMEGQRPWYIGYIVTTLETKLNLLSPDHASILRGSDLLFNWKAEDGELSDYDLFICLEPTSGPGSTIYKLSCGNKTSAVPEGFTPEQGITYYWLVRGHAPDGETVWSRPRAFKVDDDQTGNSSSSLPVAIYPNPSNNGIVYISYDLPESTRVSMSVYDINGRLLQKNELVDAPAGIATKEIELDGYAPGVYFVSIRTDRANAIKKLIIR
jgi:hypothetical protein